MLTQLPSIADPARPALVLLEMDSNIPSHDALRWLSALRAALPAPVTPSVTLCVIPVPTSVCDVAGLVEGWSSLAGVLDAAVASLAFCDVGVSFSVGVRAPVGAHPHDIPRIIGSHLPPVGAVMFPHTAAGQSLLPLALPLLHSLFSHRKPTTAPQSHCLLLADAPADPPFVCGWLAGQLAAVCDALSLPDLRRDRRVGEETPTNTKMAEEAAEVLVALTMFEGEGGGSSPVHKGPRQSGRTRKPTMHDGEEEEEMPGRPKAKARSPNAKSPAGRQKAQRSERETDVKLPPALLTDMPADVTSLPPRLDATPCKKRARGILSPFSTHGAPASLAPCVFPFPLVWSHLPV